MPRWVQLLRDSVLVGLRRLRDPRLITGILLVLAATAVSALLANPLAPTSSPLVRAVTGAPTHATADAATQVPPPEPTVNGVTVSKSASVPSFSGPDQPITYRFTFTNHGTNQINNITAMDHRPPDAVGTELPVCDGNGALFPGLTRHCTLTVTTSAADVARGEITDRFTLTFGRPGGGGTFQASVDLTVPFRAAPAIGVLKTAAPDGFSSANTLITYTYRVTNAGSDPLTDIRVTDTRLGPIDCPHATLAAGAFMDCTATYRTTAADVTAGHITNTAIATGHPPTGPAVTGTNTLTIGFARPGLAITKTGVPAAYGGPGEELTYTFLVSNTGTTDLRNVRVTDNKLGPIECPAEILAGETVECIARHVTTPADVAGGNIVNVVSADATTASGTTVHAEAAFVVTLNHDPAIEVRKTPFPATYSDAGQQITYTYLVANTGNVPLTDVTLTDDQIPGTLCTFENLPVGGERECSGTHLTTASDVALGHITNRATVSGTTTNGGTAHGETSSTVVLLNGPSLAVEKTADAQSFAAAGQAITYTYTVANTGPSEIRDITVHDAMIPGGIACRIAAIPAGQRGTCDAIHFTTPGDVANRVIENSARAEGTSVTGVPVRSPTVHLAIPLEERPGLGLTKRANVSSFSESGEHIIYTYTLSNTGNVELRNVMVTDSKFPDGVCTIAVLPAGEDATCQATYTTTPGDVTARHVTNEANASGTTPGGLSVTAPNGGVSLSIPLDERPALTLTKTADAADFAGSGLPIGYTYTVTNTGNVRLLRVTVTDSQFPGGVCIISLLPRGQSALCHATHVTTPGDVTARHVTNNATAEGTTPGDASVHADPYSLTIPLEERPELGLTKRADVTTFAGAGQHITYTYTLSNTGNVELRNLTVSDSKFPHGVCTIAVLPASGTATCQATYVTTPADVTAGHVINEAGATGTTPGGLHVPLPTGPVSIDIPLEEKPVLTLTKSADASSFARPDEPIEYTYTLANTGNVELRNVTVTDSQFPGGVCTIDVLPAGQTGTCHATHVTTPADVTARHVTNNASASAVTPGGATVPAGPYSLRIPLEEKPVLTLTKTADASSFAGPDEPITYTFRVSNTGNVDLHHVTVTDARFGTVCTLAVLPAGETATCEHSHVTTAEDVLAGQVSNTASAIGTTPGGTNVPSNEAALTIPLEERPTLNIVKVASVPSFNQAGTVITYIYRVTNTGNTPLHNVTVTDSRNLQVSCPLTTLVPGQQMECVATYTTTRADLDAGHVNNTGTVTGLTPGGVELRADYALSIPAEHAPGLSIEKTSNPLDFNRPGVLVSYTFVVTNTGNVTLHQLTVTDSRLGRINCPHTTLAPGQRMICIATHVTTAADVEAGHLGNVATVTGRTPGGAELTASTGIDVPVSPIPAPASPIIPAPPLTG